MVTPTTRQTISRPTAVAYSNSTMAVDPKRVTRRALATDCTIRILTGLASPDHNVLGNTLRTGTGRSESRTADGMA